MGDLVDQPPGRTLVSVVAPVYNEEAVVAEFVARLLVALEPLESAYDFEVILVDDGSTDGTGGILARLAREHPRLTVIELTRNFGQTQAIRAGLDHVRGEIIITLDADLQHLPDEIPGFLKKLGEGYDMVCGWRQGRAEGVARQWPSGIGNWIIRKISGLRIHDISTTFRAYRAEIVPDLELFGEFHRYIPVLGQQLGSKIAELPIRSAPRPAGRSHYGLGRSLGVALDLLLLYFLIHYLDRPMRAFGKVATLAFAAGLAIIGVLVVYAYTYNIHAVQEHSGWFLIALVLVLTGVQLVVAGIVAEILIRIRYGREGHRIYRVRRPRAAPRQA
jgi:glycosyltransferase involved in cell wall biosynthesis